MEVAGEWAFGGDGRLAPAVAQKLMHQQLTQAEKDWPRRLARGRMGAVATNACLLLNSKNGNSKGQGATPAVGGHKGKGGGGKARGDGACG